MKDTPTVIAWKHQESLTDEQEFTPWAEGGWLSWNGQSPELEICEFARTLVLMMRPAVILETGVGQGYMTRTLVEQLTDEQFLIAYESDDNWRSALWTLPFWNDNRFVTKLSAYRTPGEDFIADADLCIFDSDFQVRFTEVQWWHDFAKPGSVALIHDTADQPGTIHQSLREVIGDLGMTGVFLKNPRGCFMAVQPSKEE